MEGEYYAMEKIVGNKVNPDGSKEYLIKWKNYPKTANTYEPAENILTPGIVEAYESQYKDSKANNSAVKRSSRAESPTVDMDREMESHTYNLVPNVKAGWDHGNTAEELLGLKEFVVSGKKQLMFFVKWQGIDVCTFVPTYEANNRIPKMVIDFYESRICFTNAGQ